MIRWFWLHWLFIDFFITSDSSISLYWCKQMWIWSKYRQKASSWLWTSCSSSLVLLMRLFGLRWFSSPSFASIAFTFSISPDFYACALVPLISSAIASARDLSRDISCRVCFHSLITPSFRNYFTPMAGPAFRFLFIRAEIRYSLSHIYWYRHFDI